MYQIILLSGSVINFPLYLVDDTFGHIGLLVNHVLSDEMISRLEYFATFLGNNLTGSKKKHRAPGSHYFGFWRKYSTTIYQTKTSKEYISKQFISQIQDIWKLVSQVIFHYYPDIWSRYHYNRNQLCLPYTFGIWTCLGFNYLVQSPRHKDFADASKGLCVIIPVGNYTGGNLLLPEYNVSVEITRKSIFCMDSCNVTHENKNFVGNRSSFALFSPQNMM